MNDSNGEGKAEYSDDFDSSDEEGMLQTLYAFDKNNGRFNVT
jgi:hypothetical protein